MADAFNIILPIVYILVGVALIVFIVQLIRLLLNVNKTVTDAKKQLDPTLESVQKMTHDLEPAVARLDGMLEDLEPVMGKVDPFVDRLSLTVDAANLEIMRVDGILEDVGNVTSGISSAADAVDKISNAPLNLVNKASDSVRDMFHHKGASEESMRLGKESAERLGKDAQEQ